MLDIGGGECGGGINRNTECLILALVVCVLWIIYGNEVACYKRIVLKIYAFVNYL